MISSKHKGGGTIINHRHLETIPDRQISPPNSHASGFESAHTSGSNAKSATESDQNEQAASSDEATYFESVPVPRNEDPTLVAGEPNKWSVEGQWQIYEDAKIKNDKEKMA
ncbi:hypothetical protein H5410_003391 [Solanum commersonii]|uniref:Uncharacterized protein n=1 Tax=Solanum commersonii TaxID=4109 RepID=A0A9J6B4Z2_SOLCO|nr:hypothetical protein H5410_003391 [Solanum commersonii]